MSPLVLRDAEVEGVRADVRVEGAVVSFVGPPGSAPGADVEIGCHGGALIPGLHDHHLHLLSMAALAGSVDVGGDLDGAIRQAHADAPPGEPLRAVNYDEAVGGSLDRWRLDALAPDRAVRVQHRSGAMWVLNTRALEQVGADESDEAGVERDEQARPTGRLFRLDGWLYARLGAAFPQGSPGGGAGGDLAAVGRRLASFGVTGVTDCTPTETLHYFDAVASAVRSGALPLTVATTGGPELAETDPPLPLRRGPVKVIIADHDFPALADLCHWFDRAHRAGRAVAVHCVSRAALHLAVAAWREVGSEPGDRVEHASVTPPELVAALHELMLTVVTQPAFIAARGDAYLREVEPFDQPDLYRCASMLEAGVEVGGSTDAPFGPDDPWLAIGAAMSRRAQSGTAVGADRGLEPGPALELLLAPLERPGGPIRRITPGAVADLCLLDVPLVAVLGDPSSRHVVATISGGTPTFIR